MKQYRQGDVLIRKINVSVSGESVEEQVLAYGEVTGHAHRLVKDRPDTTIEVLNDGKGFFLKISGGSATVKHEEHEVITLSPGTYEVVRQREYDALEYQRKVRD